MKRCAGKQVPLIIRLAFTQGFLISIFQKCNFSSNVMNHYLQLKSIRMLLRTGQQRHVWICFVCLCAGHIEVSNILKENLLVFKDRDFWARNMTLKIT